MNRVQRQFVKDALDQEHELNEWEYNFINDLAERDENNPEYELSDKQNQALNKIQKKLN